MKQTRWELTGLMRNGTTDKVEVIAHNIKAATALARTAGMVKINRVREIQA